MCKKYMFELLNLTKLWLFEGRMRSGIVTGRQNFKRLFLKTVFLKTVFAIFYNLLDQLLSIFKGTNDCNPNQNKLKIFLFPIFLSLLKIKKHVDKIDNQIPECCHLTNYRVFSFALVPITAKHIIMQRKRPIALRIKTILSWETLCKLLELNRWLRLGRGR